LLPIVSATGVFSSGLPEGQRQLRNLQINQIGYLCFGLAAAFLAFDKYFGYSTGWMRYITTAMSLETALRNFRLDWAKTTSGLAGATPSGAVLEILLQKIQDFCVAARTLVEKETQAWVMEFQTNLSQLEKEAKAAMDSARAAVVTAQKEAKTSADSIYTGTTRRINCPDLESGRVRHFTTAEGLAPETVKLALRDRPGNPWFSSDSGLFLLSPEPDTPRARPRIFITGVREGGVRVTVSGPGESRVWAGSRLRSNAARCTSPSRDSRSAQARMCATSIAWRGAMRRGASPARRRTSITRAWARAATGFWCARSAPTGLRAPNPPRWRS
jgi:hypothetical protein